MIRRPPRSPLFPYTPLFRVVWADLARRLEAAPLTGRAGLGLIPLNSCYVLPVGNAAAALRVAAWLNSTWCRAVEAASADPASGGCARFNARVISALPFPSAALHDERLLALARAGAGGGVSQEE